MLPFIYFDFYSHEIGMCRWCISLQGLRPDTSKVRNVKLDDDDDEDEDASSSLFLCNHHTESRSLWEAKPRVKRGRSKHDDDAIFLYVNRHVLDAESNHYGISHGGRTEHNHDEDYLFRSATGFMTVTTNLYWQKNSCAQFHLRAHCIPPVEV